MMEEDVILINSRLAIPSQEIAYRYARSSGPGGQHVNKSETQVELLWDVRNSPSLTESQRARLLEALANRIDAEGVLHLAASETRSQSRNRQAVTERLVHLVEHALRPRRPRIATQVSQAQRVRRLDEKKRQGEVKRQRRRVDQDE